MRLLPGCYVSLIKAILMAHTATPVVFMRLPYLQAKSVISALTAERNE
jgi:hypothetical protein